MLKNNCGTHEAWWGHNFQTNKIWKGKKLPEDTLFIRGYHGL